MRTDTCCIELEFWDSTIINSVIQYQVALQVFEILGNSNRGTFSLPKYIGYDFGFEYVFWIELSN